MPSPIPSICYYRLIPKFLYNLAINVYAKQNFFLEKSNLIIINSYDQMEMGLHKLNILVR